MSACALLERKEKIQARKCTGKDLIKIVGYSIKNCDKAGSAGALLTIIIDYLTKGEISWETLNRAVMIYTLSHMVSEAFQYPEIIKKYYDKDHL